MRRIGDLVIAGWTMLAISWTALVVPLAMMNASTDPLSSSRIAPPVFEQTDLGSASDDADSFCVNAARYGTAAQRAACASPAAKSIKAKASHSPGKIES